MANNDDDENKNLIEKEKRDKDRLDKKKNWYCPCCSDTVCIWCGWIWFVIILIIFIFAMCFKYRRDEN